MFLKEVRHVQGFQKDLPTIIKVNAYLVSQWNLQKTLSTFIYL